MRHSQTLLSEGGSVKIVDYICCIDLIRKKTKTKTTNRTNKITTNKRKTQQQK